MQDGSVKIKGGNPKIPLEDHNIAAFLPRHNNDQ